MIINQLFLLVLLLEGINANAYSDNNFLIERVLQCVDKNQQTCLEWEDEVQVSTVSSENIVQCFSESTHVLTSEGPKPLSKIQVNDEILGYDFEELRPRFSKVVAWLHRDTHAQIQFIQISTQNRQYSASPAHNIGVTKNGSIIFKFAEQLKHGDQLFSIDSEVVVQNVSVRYERGLYSPYTQFGNFFIFSKNTSDVGSMIMVHCLSLAEIPEKIDDHWFHYAITSASQLINLNPHNNLAQQNYIHPLAYLLLLTQPSRQVRVKHAYLSGKNDFKGGLIKKILPNILNYLRSSELVLIN